MSKIPPGLYDLLHSRSLHTLLQEEELLDLAEWEKLSHEEIARRIATPLSRELAYYIQEIVRTTPEELLSQRLDQLVSDIPRLTAVVDGNLPWSQQVLRRIRAVGPRTQDPTRPEVSSSSCLPSGHSPYSQLQMGGRDSG